MDDKYASRLTEREKFYEDKLEILQNKYDEQLKTTNDELQKINLRNQNSTLKGQDGEEYDVSTTKFTFSESRN